MHLSAFENVRKVLRKEATRPFIKRYLKRDEIMRDIAGCDADIRAALDMFNVLIARLTFKIRVLMVSHSFLSLYVSLSRPKNQRESDRPRHKQSFQRCLLKSSRVPKTR